MQLKHLFSIATLCLCLSRLTVAQTVPPRVGLRNLAINRGLRLGTAAPLDLLRSKGDNGAFRAFVTNEFTFIEPENDFKPPAIWQGEGKYDFDRADWLLGAPGQLGWAQQNGLAVRGHVLVYAKDDGYTLPDWIRKDEANIDAAKAKQLLSDYIHALVGRYRGKVLMWDVLNEAIADSPNKRPFNLRDSFWYRKLGQDFVKLAFQYAHEADPRAELYYNDYGAEGMGWKSDSARDLVRWVRQQGVFVTGVGMQWHIGVDSKVTPGDQFYQNAQRLQDENFAFMVTELDIAVPVKSYPPTDPRYGQEPQNPGDLIKQADLYRAVLRYALNFPNCRGFNMWGCTDKHSWIPGFSQGKHGAALISDQNYQPKPAYWQLQDELAANMPLETPPSKK